jgi:3-oxoacyl-[acyl-carrier protein] reductase
MSALSDLAKEFTARCVVVIVCLRSMASAQKAQKSAILMPGQAFPEKVDVTDARRVSEFVRVLAERHKHIDILIDNVSYPFDLSIWDEGFCKVTKEDLDTEAKVDLKETLRFSQAGVYYMIRNANSGGTVILNIASTAAIAAHTAGAPYGIAKAGIIAITKHIVLQYDERNNAAYTLALGNISTDATFSSMTLTERKRAATESSMKKWGHPREVATIAASVACDDFSFSISNVIVIDGGTVMP